MYTSAGFFMEIGEAKLSAELLEFLDKGDKPIVVSFSSMPLRKPESFKQKLMAALTATGNRAVILTGTIFKKAKGLIHHGGVGTMAEALLSGAPQLIIPFSVDQPFWAHRLYAKGYALRPLREKSLETAELIEAFRNMESQHYLNKAKETKGIIQSENGLRKAVCYVEKVYAG